VRRACVFFSFGIGFFFFLSRVYYLCVWRCFGVLFFFFCFLSLFVGWNYGGVVKYVGGYGYIGMNMQDVKYLTVFLPHLLRTIGRQ
jgi:hypothetical protein